MTKTKKRLFASLAFLVLALLITTTTTFAWFTYNKQVSLTGISLNVSTEGSLLISDASDGLFTSTLAAPTAPTTLKLSDCTQKADYSMVAKDGTTARTAGTDYYEYTIYLKSDTTTGLDVKLDLADAGDGLSTLTSSHTTDTTKKVTCSSWTAIAENAYGVHGAIAAKAEIDAKAENAARVAFYTSAAESAPVLVWNPHAEAGYNKANTNMATDWGTFITTGVGPTTPSATAQESTAKNSTEAASIKLLNNVANTATMLRIRIWLEGNDGDCFNSIMADTIVASLRFVGTNHVEG